MNFTVHEISSGDATCGLLTIDLGAMAHNYRMLCETAAPAEVAAVVKADAYGLGAGPVSSMLYNQGCRSFFVAHLAEAFDLRDVLPADASLYALNGLMPGTETSAVEHGVVPVLNSYEQASNWAGVARIMGTRLKAILQIDTGMSRLGLSRADIVRLRDDGDVMQALDITCVMSHLACGDDPMSPENEAQLEIMAEIGPLFPDARISLASSDALFLGRRFYGMLARPGIALYGGRTTSSAANLIRPVVSLCIRVIQTRVVPAGTRVGYGGTFTAPHEMKLATLAAGYADGLPRHLSDTGAAYHEATRLPIVGRVSMDSMTIDISSLPDGTLDLGDYVEVIGQHQTLEDLADAAGTISYEILTRLGQRYRREYRQPDAIGA